MNLKVIGAGQMRTGTMTLKNVLERLYPDTKCYHMVEAIAREDYAMWMEVGQKESLTKSDFDAILKDFYCTVDFPSASFYKELSELYPDAKVILSVRDADEWVESVKATTLNVDLLTSIRFEGKEETMRQFRDIFMMKAYGITSDEGFNADEVTLKRIYLKFNDRVRNTISSHRLLEYNVKEGWESLCKFLEIPVPSDLPFPHLNTTKSFQEAMKQRFKK